MKTQGDRIRMALAVALTIGFAALFLAVSLRGIGVGLISGVIAAIAAQWLYPRNLFP